MVETGNCCGAPKMLALIGGTPDNTDILMHGKNCHIDLSESQTESALEQTPAATQTGLAHVLANQDEISEAEVQTPAATQAGLVHVLENQDGIEAQVDPNVTPEKNDDHLFERVAKRRLSALEKDANRWREMKKAMKRKKYVSTDIGRKLIAMAVLHAPKIGLEAASTMMSLFVTAYMADLGVQGFELIPNSTPCAKTIREFIFESATDAILLQRNLFASSPLTLMCDKGDGRKVREGANFVKLIGDYNREEKQVDITCIGISSTGNDSISAAQNIDYSLELYDTPSNRVTLDNQGTDAGGGGTREDLGNKLATTNRIRDVNEYNISTCALHALNVTLSSATELTMGTGGLKKRTALQCLHSAYNLSQAYRRAEWDTIWRLITGSSCTELASPVLSRWESVGEACRHIIKYHDEWLKVVSHIIDTEKSDTTRYVIASHLYSLLRECMIISHIHLILAFVRSWWGPNFDWNKRLDSVTGQPGFLARHMAVHYYVQHRDLLDIIANWKTNPKFTKFIASFPQNDEYTIEDLVSKYLQRVMERHTKHFTQWKNKYIHLTLASDDAIPRRLVAAWLLGDPLNEEPPLTYYSNMHRTTIDSRDLMLFLTSNINASDFRKKFFFKNHVEAIKKISEGENLWDNVSNEMVKFSEYVERNWLIIPTNTQLVERWVKDANECTFNTKEEGLADAVAVLRSVTIFRYRRRVLRLSRERILSANQHRSGGKAGSRIDKNTGNVEETNKIDLVRGAFYNCVVISEVLRETEQLKQMKTPLSDRKYILRRIKNPRMSFQTVRTNATLTSYSRSLASPIPTPNNAVANATGIDTTDHMLGRFPYGKLRIVHIHLVRVEINHRGGEFDDKMKIRVLGKLLLELELKVQRITYKARTGKDARDEDLNTSTFEPVCGTDAFNALLGT